MKYLGCAYYPEYWGRERVETDAKLMREAGVNMVRIGEFAWSRMEPEEGRYTLEWLHECIDTLSKYGINVLLCTPTATPPAWLTSTYPDTLLVRVDSRKLEHGGRRHYCYSSDTYRRHTARIVEKLSKEFSRHKNVVAWQIDNEPDICETDICYCESCQGKFQAWLKEKYESIESLNEKWSTGFWSMDYSDWRQVKLAELKAHQYSSRKLDTRRFVSHMLSDFILTQADIIKKNHPAALVSTNLNGGIFTDLDYNQMFSRLDIAYKDLYFDICTMDVNTLIMHQCRSFKPGQKYWVTETGSGAIDFGRPPHKEQFKAWMWSSYAHGADAHLVFRWRSCLSGQEQELQGMLEHSGHPGHRYRTVKEAFLEMKEISGKLGDLPLPVINVAMVHDYNVLWGYKSSVVGSEIDYEQNFCRLHEEFYKRNVPVDVIPVGRELIGYKMVVLPSLMMIGEEFAAQLKAFVEQGGVIVAQGQIGMRDSNDNYLLVRGPEHLQELLGVCINGGMYLYSQIAPDEAWNKKRRYFDMKLEGRIGEKEAAGLAKTWAGDLELNGGTVLMSYSEDTYAGQPAVVEKKTGAGTALYISAINLDEPLLGEILEYGLTRSRVEFVTNLPEYVEKVQRGEYTFYINHGYEEVQVAVGSIKEVLHGCIEKDKAILPPFGVSIVKG